MKMNDIAELLNMTATERDIREAVTDEHGVLYSEDGTFLLECRNKDLKHYTVRKGCKVICEKAFFNRHPFACILEDIMLPDGLLAIGNAAFMTCGKLRNIVMPQSLRYIGESAFELCHSLEQITLPSGLRAMGGNPLADSGVKKVVCMSPHFNVVDGCLMQDNKMVAFLSNRKLCHIPSGTREIGSEAFSNNNHLHSLILPEGLEEIGDNAFMGCTLQSLSIPSSVRKIGDNPFAFATVRTLEVKGTNFSFKNGFLVSDKGVLVAYMGALSEVVVPETVSEIGGGAFYKNKVIRSVTLPTQLKTIRHHAFAQCENLRELHIPEGVSRLGEGAFEGCQSLRYLTLPPRLSFIDDSLFANSGIEELSIPEGVTYIGKSAFTFCTHLHTIRIPESVTHIDDCAFFVCEKLTEIAILNRNIRLGAHAFDHFYAIRDKIG